MDEDEDEVVEEALRRYEAAKEDPSRLLTPEEMRERVRVYRAIEEAARGMEVDEEEFAAVLERLHEAFGDAGITREVVEEEIRRYREEKGKEGGQGA